MSFCTSCGAQNADTTKFCIKCGEALTVQAAAPVPSPPAPPQKEKRPFVLIALLIVLLLGGVLAAWQFGLFGGQGGISVSAQSWQEQYDLGVRYVKDGNYEEAIIAFTAAITIDPMQPEPYIALADAYIVLDDVDAAIAILAQGYNATGDEGIKEKQDALEAQRAADANEDDTADDTVTTEEELIAEDEAAAEPDLNDPTVVTWNDPIMEKMIRIALNKPEGDITQGELNGITELYIYGESYAEIEDTIYWDLSDIYSAPGEIFELRFADEKETLVAQPYGTLSDISDLEKLVNLTQLTLNYNIVSDLSPLAKLTNLSTLILKGNNIKDIAPLTELVGLSKLSLIGNYIVDISPFATLHNLSVLALSGNSISDITPLSGLTDLTSIGLGYNNINDITPLAGLTTLRYLNLQLNNIDDISALAGLTALENLSLDSNNISDISPLASLTKLTSLDLYDNPITDWSPVSHVETVEGRP